MRVFRMVAVIALLTGSAHAQTLIQSFVSKTPQQKADEALREKYSRESSKDVPVADPKPSGDAWGNVRSTDAAKTPASKSAASRHAKAATSVKPQTKTGSNVN